MTFINLNVRRAVLNPLALVLSLCAVFEGVFLIMLYSHTVNMRHEIYRAQERFKTVELESIELRNELYARLDPKRLRAAAEQAGFVPEARPAYLEVEAPILATGL